MILGPVRACAYCCLVCYVIGDDPGIDTLIHLRSAAAFVAAVHYKSRDM